MGELDHPVLLQKCEMGGWMDGRVKVLGTDRGSCLQSFVGAAGGWFSCSGREQAGARDLSNYTIWVTGELFICAIWHVSVDRGSCAAWKADSAEVYLFVLQAKQPNRLGRGAANLKVREYTERESDNSLSFSDSWDFKPCPSMLCTESCGVVGGREDTSSICLYDFLDHNTMRATNQRWDELCFYLWFSTQSEQCPFIKL